MPPSRHQIPPQTSRKARRAYIKAKRHFEFTPTQARASERRIELDKRAKALRAKEQRKKDNKRKRQEKEAAEREAKRQRSESSKAPIESLWGGAQASQRRLNAYFARAKTADKDEDCKSDSDDQARLAFDYDLGQGTTDNVVGQDLSGDSTGLEAFFSSPAFGNTDDMAQPLGSGAGDMLAQPAVGELVIDAQNNKHTAASRSEDAKQALVDAQLALPLRRRLRLQREKTMLLVAIDPMDDVTKLLEPLGELIEVLPPGEVLPRRQLSLSRWPDAKGANSQPNHGESRFRIQQRSRSRRGVNQCRSDACRFQNAHGFAEFLQLTHRK